MRGSKSARGAAQKEGLEVQTEPGNAEPRETSRGVLRRCAAELLLGLAWLGEALHDAFELHRRGVRGGAPRRTGERERILRTWIGDIHHDDLARLQLREQDLLGQQIFDITLNRPA